MKRLLLVPLAALLLSIELPAQQWYQVASFPGTSTYSGFSFEVGGKGYFGTGNTSATTTALSQQFWSYDPVSDSWSQQATFPGLARYEAIGFAIGSYGYAGTGFCPSDNTLADMYKYDPSLNSWSSVASLPVGWNCSVAFVIGQKAYLVTGDTLGNVGGAPSSRLWEYDATLDVWTAKSPLPATPRTRAFGFAILSKGYIGGGTNNNSTNLNDFWEYDPQLDSWVQKATLPTSPRLPAGFTIGTNGFYCTGYNSNTSSSSTQLYAYDVATDSWTPQTNFGGVMRWGTSMFVIGSTAYVGGGREGTSNYPDWWKYTLSKTGIAEYSNGLSVQISPNPVTEAASIEITGGTVSKTFTFSLYDVNGKCIQSQEVKSHFTFYRNDLSAGVYTYTISDEDGMSTGKLMVQ